MIQCQDKEEKELNCQTIVELYNQLKNITQLENYNDENWCENYPTDEYFLYVLCWAGWHEKRQETIWKEVQNKFAAIGKNLSSYTPNDVMKLSNVYPLPWQKSWLQKLIVYLTKESLSTQIFVDKLRVMG